MKKVIVAFLNFANAPVNGGPEYLSLYSESTGWTFQGSNPGGSELLRTRPDWPWGPPSLLYDGYPVFFPGVKRPGRDVNHPLPSSAEVKERVQLYLYSPSGPVLGRTLPLPVPIHNHWEFYAYAARHIHATCLSCNHPWCNVCLNVVNKHNSSFKLLIRNHGRG
jgi:hypothetical protein